MDDLATLEALRRATERTWRRSPGCGPAALVADRHPGYRSDRWAREHAGGRPVRAVQHHHAHVASAMAEHGLDGARPVIGVAFDGTGYGDDGAVWGGEFLRRRLRGVQPGRRTSPTCRCPAATPACASPTGWRSPTCGPPASTWDAGPARGAPPARRPSARVLDRQLDAGWAACRRRAWAGSSTRCPRWPASATRSAYEAAGRDRARGRWPAARRRRTRRVPVRRSTATAAVPTVADPAPVIAAVVGRRARGRRRPAVVAARFHAARGRPGHRRCERRAASGTGSTRWPCPAACSSTPC